MSNSLRPHGLQHARPPCPSPSPRVCSNPCPLSRWCHPTISPSVVPFSSCLSLSQHQGLFQWIILATPGIQSMSVSFPVLYWPHRGEELATEISRLRHGKRPAFLVSSALCIHSWYSQDSWWTPVPSFCTTQSKNLISLCFGLFICKVGMIMLPTRLPWGPLWLKNPAANTGDAVWSLGQEDPLEKEIAAHSSILVWEIPWTKGSWQAEVLGVAKELNST